MGGFLAEPAAALIVLGRRTASSSVSGDAGRHPAPTQPRAAAQWQAARYLGSRHP
jgi:hypothetical protein